VPKKAKPAAAPEKGGCAQKEGRRHKGRLGLSPAREGNAMGDNAKFENLIALAVPVFFISIAIEIVASIIMKRKVYRFNDSVSDLSAGMLQELVGVFTKVLLFGVYII
jgi:hypothetical protein